jgi:hypothetical protein
MSTYKFNYISGIVPCRIVINTLLWRHISVVLLVGYVWLLNDYSWGTYMTTHGLLVYAWFACDHDKENNLILIAFNVLFYILHIWVKLLTYSDA